MKKTEVIAALSDQENQAEVEQFASYLEDIYTKQKDGKPENAWWMNKISIQKYAELFRRVKNEGLVFDGKHVTLTNRGINYDYIAYKNKMLIAYPETIMDVELVYQGDKFVPSKDSGSVTYSHDIADPFNRTDDKIIGGYCVIKNKRGQFLTLLTREEFEKHKKVAKTTAIWDAWFREMCLKTVVKKACKVHFDDVYQTMEEEDNQQYEPELLDIPVSHKEKLEAITDLDALRDYYKKHRGLGKAFEALVLDRADEIKAMQEDDVAQPEPENSSDPEQPSQPVTEEKHDN